MEKQKSAISVNPVNGEQISQTAYLTGGDIDRALSDSFKTFQYWSTETLASKCDKINHLKRVLNENNEEYASIITLEMGKLKNEAQAEVSKCAKLCEYYANNAEQILQQHNISTEAKNSHVRFEPLGPLLAVMPWNFPFWQVFRFAVPALLAGNTVLLKHASNVSLCANKIEQAFRDANFPDHSFINLCIPSSDIHQIISSTMIAGATLTGSEKAGRALGELCGQNIKPSVLELGGSDPFIVCKDASIEDAVDAAITSRFMNAGQSCIAAKRFYVDKSVYPDFLDKFVDKVDKLRPGDPSDDKTTLAPLAKNSACEVLENQVIKTIHEGANILIKGGTHPARSGFFYSPTVLDNVTESMTTFVEEVFGPVASFSTFTSEQDAIQRANNSHYGLGASVWTDDHDRAEKLFVPQIKSGCIFVNDFVKSDPRLPFGGVKQSGYGRELSSYGLHEFVNKKTVWIS